MEGMNVKVVENRKVAISLCRSAHPGVNVTLKKKHQGKRRLFPRELVAYDPRLGFVITKVTKYFDGFFICEARYGKLTLDKDIRLLFLAATKWAPTVHLYSDHKGGQTLTGETVTFTCNATFYPYATIALAWFYPLQDEILRRPLTLCGRWTAAQAAATQHHNWIRNFLTDRHIRVRIGAELSYLFLMENGSPHGSVISPVLFIIMMNDIPEPANDVKLSLYADDSAIRRAGQNPEVNRRHLQSYLARLKKFFNEWGFKVSTTKTVAVEFCRSGTPNSPSADEAGDLAPAQPEQRQVPWSSFDRHLTWSEHIQYVVDRCRKRLNLMERFEEPSLLLYR